MTRPDRFHELKLALPHVIELEYALPPLSAPWDELVEWARRLRAGRAADEEQLRRKRTAEASVGWRMRSVRQRQA